MAGRIAELEAENRHLRERIDQLEAQVRRLTDELEDFRQKGLRQAAPFRREERSKVPADERKSPGRKQGHPGSFRREPETIDERVEVPLDNCPCCGGKVFDVRRLRQIIEELPVVRPRVTEVITYRGRCSRCGHVQSTHSLQTSTALGAAGVQLGPKAQSYAVALNKQYGLTIRNTCRVLKGLMGLHVTPGGISQIVTRAAQKAGRAYEGLVEAVRGSPAVFADETSWWVGRPGWWLWTFTTADTTLYHVDDSRGSSVVAEILGEYSGMLVSDCLGSYDPCEYRKHKCIAHHQRAISRQIKIAGAASSRYLLDWKVLFVAATALYKARTEMSEERFIAAREKLESRIEALLGEVVTQEHDRRIRNRLSKQRQHLLGCLYEPAAEPTNNRAERALRPAVIARKVSCGNKTQRGKEAWQILVSLAVTCRQRSQDFADFLAQKLVLPQTR